MVSTFTSLNSVEIYELGWPAIRAGIYLAGQSKAEAEMFEAVQHWHLEV